MGEVITRENCFPSGEFYWIFVKFKIVKKYHKWTIHVDGRRINNLTGILFDGRKNATLMIGPAQYGRPGDAQLKVTVSPKGVITTIISRIICTRLLSNYMSVTMKSDGIVGQPIKIRITKKKAMPVCNFTINYGDGTKKEIPGFSLNEKNLLKTYTRAGKFSLTWHCYNKYMISQGNMRTTIIVYEPVNAPKRYLFPTEITISRPNRSASFFITSDCLSKPPTDAVYRIDYGDGSKFTSWTRVPHYECGKSSKLPTHTYDKSGCYNVKFQIKNLLGFSSDSCTVSMEHELNSFRLRFRSIFPLLQSSKVIESNDTVYLQDEYPFQVEAVVKGSTCFQFTWGIDKPMWRKSTKNMQRVTINHLVGTAGNYYLHVFVTNKRRKLSKRKKIALLMPLQGLALLIADPSNEGKTNIYLLVKEPGSSPVLTFNFGDGKIIKDKYAIFTAATKLPNIKNVPGSSKLDLATYRGLYKQHKYVSNGLFHVLVKATDRVRELTARRTVLFSKSACSRPKVNILKKERMKGFHFSIGVTFTVQTNVQVICDNSNRSNFNWKIFASSKKDMGNAKIAESDRKIK